MLVVTEYTGETPADEATVRKFASPLGAVQALLEECTLDELNWLALHGLRAAKRAVAQKRIMEVADVGGEAGTA